MPSTVPALQLDQFYVRRLLIDWRPPTAPTVDIEEVKCDFSYDVSQHKQEPLRYRMILRFKMEELGKQEASTGYVIEAETVGLFSVASDFDAPKRPILVRVNGLNMLYGSLRGVLAGITGPFPGGTITLPSIKPQAVVEEVERRKNAEAEKNTKKAKPGAGQKKR